MKGTRRFLASLLVAVPVVALSADPAPGAPPPDPASQARAAYRRGAELYRTGKYRDAIAALIKAEAKAPPRPRRATSRSRPARSS